MPDSLERPEQCSGLSFSQATKAKGVAEDGVVSYARSIQAARARRMAMDAVAKVFDDFDVIVAPTGGEQLVITNLTGHPALILPNGLRDSDAPKYPSDDPSDFRNSGGPGTPTSLTFLGKLYGEVELLAFARAYQEATGFHLLRPKLTPGS